MFIISEHCLLMSMYVVNQLGGNSAALVTFVLKIHFEVENFLGLRNNKSDLFLPPTCLSDSLHIFVIHFIVVFLFAYSLNCLFTEIICVFSQVFHNPKKIAAFLM